MIVNADAQGNPVLESILGFLGMDLSGMNRADVKAEFSIDGPVVKLKSGRLSSPMIAVEAMEGGTMNMENGRIDLYVIALSLRQVGKMLSLLPGGGLVNSFTDKLMRLHVMGDWNNRDSIRVTKEPLKDIAVGTTDFFKQAVRGGGNIGGSLLKGVGNLFKGVEGEQALDWSEAIAEENFPHGGASIRTSLLRLIKKTGHRAASGLVS